MTDTQNTTGRQQELLDGDYYFFDCMNAFITDRYFEVSAFDGDPDAIKTAANYEATLTRLTFSQGELTGSKTLYDPWDCFN